MKLSALLLTAVVFLVVGLVANLDALFEAYGILMPGPGRWYTPDAEATLEERRARLESLGYLQAYNPAVEEHGILYHDESATQPGLNFFNSGHAPPVAYLMTLDGTVVHSWNHSLGDRWPGDHRSHFRTYWRRAFLLPDGGLLAIHEGLGLLRLDRESRLIWDHAGGEHHDLHVDPEGTIYAISHKRERRPDVDPAGYVLVDYVTILDENGTLLREVDLLDAIMASPYRNLTAESGGFHFKDAWDFMHCNSIQVFDGSLDHLSPLYESGNALISMRDMDTLLIVDLDEERVLWARTRAENLSWHRQHEAVLLPTGSMLVFDNKGPGNHSRVVEFDPLTGEVLWVFDGMPHHPFYTGYFGTAQRLANGNTLVADSENGRAFEVTVDQELVWEYLSPFRAGEGNQLVAVLFAIERVPCNETSWLTHANCSLKAGP